MQVWVLGASGLLGASLCPFLSQKGYTVMTHRSSGSGTDMIADLSDGVEAAKAFNQTIESGKPPDVIINLAALTNVDQCETYPDRAYRLNTGLVENVVRWIKSTSPKTHLIHISTDQVYDGDGQAAESDVRITNTYAFSKYAGELAAQLIGATVLRTNFVGVSECEGRQTLSDWLVASLRKQEPITLFEDVLFAPLSIVELCKMIEVVIQQRHPGVFNLGSKAAISKAEFAERLAAGLGLSLDSAQRKSVREFEFKAYRPKNMAWQ